MWIPVYKTQWNLGLQEKLQKSTHGFYRGGLCCTFIDKTIAACWST